MNNKETHRTSVTMKYYHSMYLIKDDLKKIQEKRIIYHVDFICCRQELLKCSHSIFSSKNLSRTQMSS